MDSFLTIFVNLLSIVLLVVVIILALKQKTSTVAINVAIVTAFMLIWAIGSLGEMFSQGFSAKLFWRNLTQIGSFYLPAACLMFSVRYSGILRNIRKGLEWGIYVLQTISILLIFTDQWHHLMRKSIELSNGSLLPVILVKSTILGYALVSVNFILTIAAVGLLFIFALRTKNMMRKQVLVTVVGMSITMLYAVIKVICSERIAINIPISGVFAFTSLMMLLGIFKYDFIMVLPFARNKVFDFVEEGIIVSSMEGDILDANPAARHIFSIKGQATEIARDVKEVKQVITDGYPLLHRAFLKASPEKFSLKSPDSKYDYECKIYEIKNDKSKPIGMITVVRDVTEQKNNLELLKIKAERDGLTGVYNRITFIEIAENEINAYHNEIALIFMDIDDFKRINDVYGHVTGDFVLKEVCECISRVIGANAVLGRIGGEEFAVLLKDETDPTRIAENIRKEIQEHSFAYQGTSIHVTISAGVSGGRNMAFHRLYQKADRMLNLAKQQGKNCVRHDRP